MIYAIRAVGTEYIKFGKANSVGKRLKELDCACPLDLEIVGTANWPNETERAVHRLLEKHHIKGEWFRESPDTHQIIQWMLNGQAGLERILDEMKRERYAQGLPSRTRATAPAETPISKRRAEREAWWNMEKQRSNGVLSTGKSVSA